MIYDMSTAKVYEKVPTVVFARQVRYNGENIRAREGLQFVPKGDWIIRGEEGDVWSNTTETFTNNYTFLRPALVDEGDTRGMYRSNPKKVLALPIPEDMDLTLHGDPHHGTRGDYLVVHITPEMEEAGDVARILSDEGYGVDLDKVRRYFIDPELFHTRYKEIDHAAPH